MEQWIEYAGCPDELILAWQAPASSPDRTRWAIGKLAASQKQIQFRYFDDEELSDFNLGRTRSDLLNAGYHGYPAFDWLKSSHVFSDGVLDAFARRLPPRSRSDFEEYLRHFRLKPTNNLSPLSLLAATEAQLPSDGFSLIDPLNPQTEYQDVFFEIAGHRFYKSNRSSLVVGQPLMLVPDTSNKYDVNAIKLMANGEVIGYVNRLQSKSITLWLRSRLVSTTLARLNGSTEKPRAFALLRVRPRDAKAAA